MLARWRTQGVRSASRGTPALEKSAAKQGYLRRPGSERLRDVREGSFVDNRLRYQREVLKKEPRDFLQQPGDVANGVRPRLVAPTPMLPRVKAEARSRMSLDQSSRLEWDRHTGDAAMANTPGYMDKVELAFHRADTRKLVLDRFNLERKAFGEAEQKRRQAQHLRREGKFWRSTLRDIKLDTLRAAQRAHSDLAKGERMRRSR
ncbi:MAG: hypothetical protein MHM6MM_009472 [Cercozoa sp. M6MM]